jgi:uncharacterized cupin superfamily protein
VSIAHWDEVEKHHRAKGPMDATWSRLGDAAGAKGVGVNRIEIAAGKLSTPPHSHGASEEIYYVLGGSGLAWQDEEVCEVGPGDCIVQVANHFEHTLRGGPDGLDVLVFGTRHPTEIGWLPRSNAIRIGYPWVEGRIDDPWDVEEQVGELEFSEPGPRPANIVAADEAEARFGGTARFLGAAGGAEHTGLNLLTLEDGKRGAPPHCHSAEEEVFVVLEGQGTLELWPSAAAGAAPEPGTHDLEAGHVIARPPGTGVAHGFKGGAGGMTLLAYGTKEPNDIAYYPRSDKVAFRGIKLIGRLDRLDYFDGEPDD